LTEIVSEPEAGGPHGIDRIEFWVQTNPGTRAGPLMKVASGGELARFLLALKVVLADRGSASTLVFDEVDTGAGGAVADAIGVRLARLSRRAQVIAVTHAPQVAARAERDYLISKSALDKGARVATRVAELAADKRREEIARMRAGATRRSRGGFPRWYGRIRPRAASAPSRRKNLPKSVTPYRCFRSAMPLLMPRWLSSWSGCGDFCVCPRTRGRCSRPSRRSTASPARCATRTAVWCAARPAATARKARTSPR